MERNILIRSASRMSSSTSSSNCVIQLTDKIDLGGKQKLDLLYFQLYNTLYNITSSNNALNFNENSTNKAITPLPVGLSDANSLAIALTSALNTASGGYATFTVTYNTTTRLFTIASTQLFTLLFATGAASSTSLYKVLGWTTSNGLSPVDSSAGTSATAPYIANLAIPMSILVRMPNLGMQSIIADPTNRLEFTFYIPVNSSGGSIIEYTTQSYFPQTVRLSNEIKILELIKIELIDTNGNALNLNNSEFEMIVKAC